MNTLELNKMGLAPMTEFEMQEVDGGSIFSKIANWISDNINTIIAVVVIVAAAALVVDAAVIGIAAVFS